MKGRPITTEEFERMLSVTPKMGLRDVAGWRRYLTGLWLSGLRLAESLILSWDEGQSFAVDLTGKHPQFRIMAEGQKSWRDEFLPMTPDFAEWLLGTPESQRRGRVFQMTGKTGRAVNADAVGRLVSAIGEIAGVVTDKAAGKHATAHDLRRSFGTRWSKRVKPATLQRLMRHADIKTTMDFYVQQDADDIAADLWADHKKLGDTSGDTYQLSASTDV